MKQKSDRINKRINKRLNAFQRRYLIDWKMQLSLMSLMTLPVFTSWLIFLLGFRFALTPLFIQAQGVDSDTNQKIESLLHLVVSNFDQYFMLSFVVSFACIFILGIVVTNRIAGPIYRLKAILRGEGEAGSFSFRKHDYFKEIPELLGKYADKKNKPKDE